MGLKADINVKELTADMWKTLEAPPHLRKAYILIESAHDERIGLFFKVGYRYDINEVIEKTHVRLCFFTHETIKQMLQRNALDKVGNISELSKEFIRALNE